MLKNERREWKDNEKENEKENEKKMKVNERERPCVVYIPWTKFRKIEGARLFLSFCLNERTIVCTIMSVCESLPVSFIVRRRTRPTFEGCQAENQGG